MLRSFFSAMRMYSRIPVPDVEWNEENRRYSLCFFPAVGAVIGAMIMIWQRLCAGLHTGQFMYAAGAVAIMVAVTGGIHLDGFCDTCDARASWGDRDKKLRILSDPHIGAFAAIKLGIYLVLYTALFTELTEPHAAAVVCLGFVLSRALSGLAAVTFRSAKREGTLHVFSAAADKKTALFCLSFTAVLSMGVMTLTDMPTGAAAAAAALLVFAWYRFVSYREFGGITGDLAGWFLQVCELSVAAAAAFTYRIMEVR